MSYLVGPGVQFEALVPQGLAGIVLTRLVGIGSVLEGLEEVSHAVVHLGVVLLGVHGAAKNMVESLRKDHGKLTLHICCILHHAH